ncbi:hypothetical protein Sliba_44840 [Streptomyces nigrescens]|uniref:OmpR/PhoB-type domain-containing protein n=1 Tax=Streptomyces nigrescens TaxID=1920 RepID=A0A640TP28_STRNI|nr:winged helix-turn-helix domain-containing protein [Streptomyces libani]GFE24031.1 hypothetical protein Sliba_44840 [Streptomyces libani subsp. libani]
MDDGPGRERLRFTVLGPVRAWRGATPLAAGSPQQRALLAALLLRGGRTATAPELVDDLWGDEPPHAALAALRTYASRLRKALGDDAETLVSESGGYAIRPVDGRPLDLDTWRAPATRASSSPTVRRHWNGCSTRADAFSPVLGSPAARTPCDGLPICCSSRRTWPNPVPTRCSTSKPMPRC